MTRLLGAFAVIAAFAVVVVFGIALVNALPVRDAFVVVVADASVPIGAPWRLRVSAVDERGPARFSGTINGHPLPPDDVVELTRAARLVFDGTSTGEGGDVACAVDFAVPVIDADDRWTLGGPRAASGAGLLPLHDGMPRARIVTTAPAPGGEVLVDVDGTARAVQLLVGGRLIDDRRLDGRSVDVQAFKVPAAAPPGALIVVSVADSPWPSARARTLSTFVGGPVTHDLGDEALTRVVPARARVGDVAPSPDEQRGQRQERARAAALRWRGRLRDVELALLVVVVALALPRLRQAPVAVAGAIVVVAALLWSLDLVVGFVS